MSDDPKTVGKTAANEEVLCSTAKETIKKLDSSEKGLTRGEVEKRIEEYGYNELAKKKKRTLLMGLLKYFKNPLIVILMAAALISALVGETINATIIFLMVLMSVLLDFFQEHKAEKAAESLKKRVATTSAVMRDGAKREVRVSEIVPGDIILLSAGDIVPADARVITFKDFYVDQSSLTGESFPVEKGSEPIKKRTFPRSLNGTTICSWAHRLSAAQRWRSL